MEPVLVGFFLLAAYDATQSAPTTDKTAPISSQQTQHSKGTHNHFQQLSLQSLVFSKHLPVCLLFKKHHSFSNPRIVCLLKISKLRTKKNLVPLKHNGLYIKIYTSMLMVFKLYVC